MFSRKEHLLMKTGPEGIGRYDYLRLLKKEFYETNSEDAKGQILANLANFSYDPINYDYIRSLDIIYLFLNELNSTNSNFVRFAAAAICNLSSDPLNCQHIICPNGIKIITSMLSNPQEEILINIIAALIFLQRNVSKEELSSTITPVFFDRVKDLRDSSSSVRVRQLATVFLERYVVPCASHCQDT